MEISRVWVGKSRESDNEMLRDALRLFRLVHERARERVRKCQIVIQISVANEQFKQFRVQETSASQIRG